MKTLRERTLEIMQGYAGKVVEQTGHNDGVQINKFQDLLDLKEGTAQDTGDPYCVASLIFALTKANCEQMGLDVTVWANLEEKALPDLVKKSIIKQTGGCTDLMNWAKDHGRWIPKEEIERMTPGDWVIFDFTPPGKALQRHIGIVAARTPSGLNTVEGNTAPDAQDRGTNDEAGGVFAKRRTLSKVMGFVHIAG